MGKVFVGVNMRFLFRKFNFEFFLFMVGSVFGVFILLVGGVWCGLCS